MNKKIHLSIVLIIISFTSAFSQVNVDIGRWDFKLDKDGFRDAWNAVKDGDDYFELGIAAYPKALEFYKKAYNYNPDHPGLNYKLGVCYLHSTKKRKALEYLKKAYNKKQNIAFDIHLQIGNAYRYRYEFDKAIQEYQQFKASLNPNELDEFETKIKRKINACRTAQELTKDTVRVFIDNLGPNVNSQYDDYYPLITADDSVLYFTSRRASTTGGEINEYNNKYFEDIYKSVKIDGQWQEAQNIGKPINTEQNEAAVGLTPDGQKLYVYYGRKHNGDIYYSNKQGDKWSNTSTVGRKINTPNHESSISLSYDGKELFFVSNKESGSIGGRDIFVSKKNDDGEWTEPENLGQVINTPYNEEGVFIHPDNKTLYFSSKGHNTMGGYDIFVSKRDSNGNWSEPENIGYPINTPDDDLFITVAANKKHGYYTSSRAGGEGGKDIYKITFLGPEKKQLQSNQDNLIASISKPVKETITETQVKVEKNRLSLVKGTVKDAETGKPLEANIKIVDNTNNEEIISKKTNSKTGKFTVPLPFGKNYNLTINKDGYLFHSKNFNISEYSEKSYEEVNLDIRLKKLEQGAKVVLNNVFFETDKVKPISTSYPELSRLVKVMKNNPELRIKITGHTDNVGSLEYNKKLSSERAQNVVGYLTENGISPDRLVAEGKADKDPIATNETEEGRMKNRRVEAKIIQ